MYRSYKPVGTSTQKGVSTAQGQHTETKKSGRTRFSGTMGQGVAELYSRTQNMEMWKYGNAIY